MKREEETKDKMTENSFKHSSSVNIQFEDLSVKIPGKKTRYILNSLHGSFCGGNLIGILGPSGAGKSTLLNVLTGRTTEGYTGNVKINGVQRNLKAFQKLSCYIMQEDFVQKQLTVKESMDYAAKLKLDKNVDDKNREMIVGSIINILGLETTKEMRTENLSGGQRKRLIIALELINNPAVLFLDEPTTGLDNVVAKQCIQYLKELSKQGKTVICTIHQPSDLLFYLFDQVYFMSEGFCVYNGNVNLIVPFLEELGHPCPYYSSPADHLIELCGNKEITTILSTATRNGIINNCTINYNKNIADCQDQNESVNSDEEHNDIFEYPVPFHSQVYVLLSRMFLQFSRNKITLGLQFLQTFICGIVVGIIFFGFGNDASQALANGKLQITIVLYYFFTYLMNPILTYYLELDLVKRECFNHWFSLKAYYTALTIFHIPVTIISSIIFNTIIYTMTNQPMEITRFLYFNIIILLIAFTSYEIGLAIGSTFKPIEGTTVGSVLGVIFLLLSYHGLDFGNTISSTMKFFISLVYIRHGVVGIFVIIFRGREMLECDDEIFCYFRDPELMLRIMGLSETSIEFTFMMCTIYLVTSKLLSYILIKRAVKPKIRL